MASDSKYEDQVRWGIEYIEETYGEGNKVFGIGEDNG